ncbi:MAG: hypothetical protein QGE94_00460, partial [Desulfobacterales bacterium]|nr:hypothetical protein [Desulfobacterales bacterium]
IVIPGDLNYNQVSEVNQFNAFAVSVPHAFYRRISNIQIHLTPTLGWPLYTDIHSLKIYPRHLDNQLMN